MDDPDVEWRELESRHFVIHYPAGREAYAKRALSIAEEAHGVLVPNLKWEPRTKTLISVVDYLDFANGWSRTTPRNEIRLYAYPPFNDEELGLYDDWMRTLIYHEYTHALHTDNSSGLHDVLNVIFGKFAKNNAALPHWYTEGLAVYYETVMSNRGRLRNALYHVMLFNAARDRVIPSLGTLSTGPVKWPGGSASYLFGSFFIQYIASIYGEEALTDFNRELGNDWLPYALNRAALRIFNKTWEDLYDTWRREVYEEADRVYQAEEDHVTRHSLLMKPHRHSQAQWVPGEHALSYVKNDGYHPMAIYKYDIDSGKETMLVECWGECVHRWDVDHHRLIFMHLTTLDGYRKQEMLYEMDLQSGKVKKLDIPGRIRSFDIDGDILYWVALEGDVMVLYQAASDGKILELYRSKAFEQIENLDAKDGQILASVFDPERHAFDIRKYVHGSFDTLMRDQELDISPFWMHDGRIGYVSAHERRLNLWAWDESSGRAERLTHLLDGMIQPVEAPNGDIYYTAYTSEGTTIARIDHQDLQKYEEYMEKPDSEQEVTYMPLGDVSLSSATRYRPWQWLWPLNWYPSLSYNALDKARIGLTFNGSDTLDHHSYNASFEYLTGKGRFDFNLSYMWTALLWDISLSAGMTQNASTYQDGKRTRYYDYQLVYANVGVSRVLNARMSTHSLVFQYQLNYLKAHDTFTWSHRDPAASIWIPSLGWQNALYASWEWSSLRQMERAVSTGAGYAAWARARVEAPWLGADHYTLMAEFGAAGAWTMPYIDTHVVWLKVAGGTSWSEDPQRYPFVLSSASGISLNGGNVWMHGYASGSIYGAHYLYGHLAYDAGIWDADLGYSTLPIGLSRFGAGVFADWGYAWRNDYWNILNSKYSLGVNLYIDWILGYRLPVRMTLGYAWGGAPRGGHQGFVYFSY
ncbi:MAG: hypothetical protein IKY83_13095 [Proteobacteria bacterium]|nr:hypothetical protein [Pseudomonadota bacterium]